MVRKIRIPLLAAIACLVISGCQLTRGPLDVTPLTDDLANHLKGHVDAVVRRAGGAPPKPDIVPAGVESSEMTARAIETVYGPPASIPGAGYSHATNSTSSPDAALDSAMPWQGDKPEERTGGGGLALPMVGNVPDMARRLLPPIQLWPGKEAVQTDEQARAAAKSALKSLIDAAQVEVDRLTPEGRTAVDRQLYIRQHVYLRLASMLDDNPQDALTPIPGLTDAEKEFWQNVFWAAISYFDNTSMPEPAERATQTIARLDNAIRNLQPLAQLSLEHLALCRHIRGFGVFEPFEKNEFSPGQKVLLYVEVKNFTSRPSQLGRQRTLLKSTITIQQDSPDGKIMKLIHVAPTEDLCRSTRRDYFQNYDFAIPRSLPLGRYSLTLTVTDLLSQKTASESLRLTVR